MNRVKNLFIFLVLISNLIPAQIVITMDNDTAGFEISDGWNYKELRGSWKETAYFKGKGEGNQTATWNLNLLFPGEYKIETYSIDYDFAKDSRWTVKTKQGDTTVIVDLNYSPGWNSLGTFYLPETTYVATSDYFESDTGQYVIADAIRLTSQMDLFSISGEVGVGPNPRKSETELSLYKAGTQQILKDKILPPETKQFEFNKLPSGFYRVQCVRWGYDTLTVDSIEISNDNEDLATLDMTRSSSAIYSINGVISYSDKNDTASCRVELYSKDNNLLVGVDSIAHQEYYQFENLPPGNYALKFLNKGYTNDTHSYQNITITDSDLEVDPLTFEVEFKFAWITDSHIGLSSTNPGIQEVIDSINANKSMMDFVVHTGDITEKGTNSELSTAKRYLGACELPMYIVPGNHDSKWTESGMQTYKNYFGEMYYSFDHKGFHFIGLNNAIYLRGGGGYFDPVQLDWLKNDLAGMDDPNKPVIVFYHLPSDQSSVSNSWRVLDILKQYRTALVLFGHGHSNRKYDFAGIKAVMSMDTYSSSGSGFNVVSISKKDITITPFYNGAGLGERWFQTPCVDSAQPQIEFTNLADGEVVTEEKTVNVSIGESVVSGIYKFSPEGSGTISGSDRDWSFDIDPADLKNGYHTVTITLKTASGKNIKKTCSFYTENGSYPKAKWRYRTGAEIISRPVYDSSRAYVGTSAGEIHAINLNNGSAAWSPVQTGGLVLSSPVVADSILLIGSADGNLYAINTANGNVNWTYEAGAPILSPVVVRDSLIYFAGRNKMYAVNRYTRQKIWTYTAGQLIECKPAIEEDRIIFGSWDAKVYCVDRFTGKLKWDWNRHGNFYYSPAACWPVTTDKFTYVVDPERYITALNIDNGKVVWQNNDYDAWESIGINTNEDQVYVRSLDGHLYAFEAGNNSAAKIWEADINYGWDSTPSMPVGTGGLVLSGGKKGFVAAVGQNDGSTKWKYWASNSYVTTVNPINEDRVLAAALDGTVTLIEGDPTLSIESSKQDNIPTTNELYNPYPNPFNHSVNIAYSIQKPQSLSLIIYDIKGRRIFNKKLDHVNNGRFKFIWNGKNNAGDNLPTGMYFIKLKSANFQKTKKIVLLK